MKTATSKNVQNLQETVQAQQAYNMILSGHIVALHNKLVHLDKQIQIHCIYPHQQSDTIQLNAPEYDPDIDGDTDPVNAVQSSNTDTGKEEVITSTTETEDDNTTSSTTHRSEHQFLTTCPDSQITEPHDAQQ